MTTSADAELLELGRRFEAAWAIERQAAVAYNRGEMSEAEWEPILAATSAILDQIEATPATTLAGFHVKARAIAWCWSGDPVELSACTSDPTTDLRIADSLLRDMLRLSAPFADVGDAVAGQ